MEKEIIILLLALVDYLFYPYNLATPEEKVYRRNKVTFAANTLREKVK